MWHAHFKRKEALTDYVTRNLKKQHIRLGEGDRQLSEFEGMLNPKALILGFARRFATYKRATLIFRNLDKLRRILNNPERPVQIVFAGKAHPADDPGKALIETIYKMSRDEEFKGKIIFLENYDIDMARYLVSGTDVWLNNPIRPYEASGTSGQKAALNGQPNCSILDGWWAEGYNGKNGWAIGEERDYRDQEIQAEDDSNSLYDILEQDIIPTFFDQDSDGVPHRWISYMKEAIRTCAPQFSMRRMVKDYTNHFYVPEIRQGNLVRENHYERERQLAAWKEHVYQAWKKLELYVDGRREGQLSLGEGIDIHAWVRANDLNPEDISVELVYGEAEDELAIPRFAFPMTFVKRENDGSYRYDIQLKPNESGSIVYNIRVIPSHPSLTEKYEVGLIRWA